MAKSTSKWDLSNWTAGPVTLFQALGIKANIQYPQLMPQLSQHVAAQQGLSPGTQHSGITPSSQQPSGKNEAANKVLGQKLAASYGWGSGDQWNALNNIVMAESGWNNQAQNPSSTAYGIGQFLDTTWSSVGATKTSNATAQINAMLKYIQQRYGTPAAAWKFHLANGWY